MKHGAKLVFYRTLFSQSAASITMGSLAAVLRKHGHPADLCLLERNSPNNIATLVRQHDICPVIIAKPNFKDYNELFKLVSEAKEQGIFKRAFLCGPFATANSEDLIKRISWIDGIIEGEPEETALELLASLQPDFLTWNFQCAGGIWRNPLTKQVNPGPKRTTTFSLDDLVFPARDVEIKEQVNYVNLEASRGCYYNCSFCHVPLMYGQSNKSHLRVRSPKLVVDEIEYLNKNLGKTLFIFNDSTFWGNKHDDNRIIEFCNELVRRKMNIHYYVYLRCSPWPSDAVLRAMVNTGLVRVFLGVENASPPTLNTYRKFINVEDFLYVKEKLDAHKVDIHIGYITFQPYSTLDEIQTSIDFLHSITNLYRLGVILEPVRVIPHLALHHKLVQDGLLSKDAPFDQITYGYNFKQPLVGQLHNGIKKMFEQTLNNRGYAVEYQCVAGQLAKTLAERTNTECTQALQQEFAAFDTARVDTNNVLRQYFNAAITQVRQGAGVDELCSLEIHKEFMQRFDVVERRLALSWGILHEGIRRTCDDRVIKEIFKGVEGI